ncbi:hypothetical protein [Paenibacillus tengchongensis]|uniref:hypothetical protein n=1 Tax=Paenibacillus tengchongensis TaxID=2608684 RepID=UPI00124E5990|nr:hypothetical protein [Paenibacillus tengchongensis]
MNKNRTITAAVLLTCTLAAGVTAVSAAPAFFPGTKSSPQVASAIPASAATPAISAETREQLARQWAEAWKSRDGKLRFVIMSGKLQEEYRSRQALETGDADNDVIRWSSPWVEEYTIATEEDTVLITYQYTDSSGNRYEGSERLSFGAEKGQTVVTGCETLEEMKQLS